MRRGRTKRSLPSKDENRRPTPWVLLSVILIFTFAFWLIVIWVLPGQSLTEIYRLWSSPGYAGFSLFAVSTFIVLLLLYLLIFESVQGRRAGNRFAVALCLLSVLPLAAVGGFLVELAHMPTNFLWWGPDTLDEPFDREGEFLGRVLSVTDEGPTRSLQVVLENGEKVVVAAVPRFAEPSEAENVSVQRLAGRYTHTLCYRLTSYLPTGWLDLSTERTLKKLE